MIWPAWLDIVLGGCGLIWCLDTWRKLQTRAPWHPHLVPSSPPWQTSAVQVVGSRLLRHDVLDPDRSAAGR